MQLPHKHKHTHFSFLFSSTICAKISRDSTHLTLLKQRQQLHGGENELIVRLRNCLNDSISHFMYCSYETVYSSASAIFRVNELIILTQQPQQSDCKFATAKRPLSYLNETK